MTQAAGSDFLVISPKDQRFLHGRFNFQEYTYVFVDSTDDRTIEEVTAPAFQFRFTEGERWRVSTFGGDLGPEIRYLWVRLKVLSQSAIDEAWLINISAGEVDLFVPVDSSRYIHQRSGSVLPFRKRDLQGSYGILPCFPLRLPAGDTLTLYFRLRGAGYPLRNEAAVHFDQTIFRPEVYAAWARHTRFLDALVIGILLAVAIYHLIIFLYQRQYVSLFFSAFVLCIALLLMMFGGYTQEFFFPSYNHQNGIVFVPCAYFMLFLFLYLFSRLYLKLPDMLPVWDKIWAGLILLDLLTATLLIHLVLSTGGLWNMSPGPFFRLVSWRGVINFPLYAMPAAAAAAAWFKGNKAAGIYLLAILAFVLHSLSKDVFAWFGLTTLPPWINGNLGATIMVLLFAAGIARQLKTLQEEKFTAEQAEQLERAEAGRIRELDEFKSRFYTNITHQFRTPLTIILGMIDQIQAHPSTWLPQGAGMIRRSGRRLLGLVDQVLSLSRLEAGQLPTHFVQGNVVRYLKYIVESFHSSAGQKKIRLLFSAEQQELVIDYDPDKLMDILSNLLSNAIKFTPPGGRVQISVRVEDIPEERLLILVSDNGPGILPEDLPKIFDRFYRTTQQPDHRQGAGIGLALTYELVRLLQGEITVESEAGKGAAFLVILPITRSAPLGHDFDQSDVHPSGSGYFSQPETVPMSKGEYLADQRTTLLIVEDNQDVVEYLGALLSSRFRMEVARDGEEGLNSARELLPDIIISDVMMPGMDGLEMCRQLKADLRTSHIPIILLTAKADVASRIKGLRTGADAYLAKPFNQTELLIRIDKLIEGRRWLQERYRDLSFLFQPRHVLPEADLHPEDHFMRELHAIIEENLSDPTFTISRVCEKTGMSRALLYKKFKALTNQSIADFIRRIRLHKARELLQTTRLNVSQVSIEVGFKNLSTFTRNFTEEFGMNPSEVRKQVS